MGFLDTLRERFGGAQDDEYYDDEYYEDDEYDEGDAGQPHVRETGSSNRLLGNPSRPEAESVSVYTRSGRPVSATPAVPYEQQRSQSRAQASAAAPMQTSNTLNFQQTSRVRSGQLPPYVLRPVSYEDVQSVVRRVRTGQPVVLVLKNTNTEVAKRILDFSFGFSYGIEGSVEEIGERVFVVLPQGSQLSQADLDKLAVDGDITK